MRKLNGNAGPLGVDGDKLMNAQRANEILDSIQSKQVLVIGDTMLDCYVHGHVARISPEAPVPVVQVSNERQVPGGSSNVALNLAVLGCDASLCGCIGDDTDGHALETLLTSRQVNSSHLVKLSGRRTTVKTRIMADRQQIVRVDWDDTTPLSASDIDQLCGKIAEAACDADAIILEDYGKGVINQHIIECVKEIVAKKDIPLGLDPKEGHDLVLNGLSVVTPNRKEAFTAAGVVESFPLDNPLEDQALLTVSEKLRAAWDSDMLLITLGAQGMLLIKAEGAPLHIPTMAREVFDVSGAGDTVIAVFVASLSAGATADEAAQLANAAAGVVVSKLGTATVTREEILSVIA